MEMKKCLIIVDMLNDFVGTKEQKGALEVADASAIVAGIAKKAEEFVVNRNMVVFANDAHAEDDPEFKSFPKHCVTGEWGAEVVNELQPWMKIGNVFNKVTFSGFDSAGLDAYLKRNDVDEIYVCGVATDYFIKHTDLDGLAKGYKVFVYDSLVKGLDSSVEALRIMAGKGVKII
jgi:nicotinamidase-related amidase